MGLNGMNYCDNCYVATAEDFCPLCGSKKLRAVETEDFCLLTEIDRMNAQRLIDALTKNDIPCNALPYGTGVESKFALPLENLRLYVPFRTLENAESIVYAVQDLQTEDLKKHILDNINLLHVSAKLEKKCRKKLKLSEEEDFFDFCINIIENAYAVLDRGRIIGCPKGGRYLYCYFNNLTLSLNSETLEILFLMQT